MKVEGIELVNERVAQSLVQYQKTNNEEKILTNELQDLVVFNEKTRKLKVLEIVIKRTIDIVGAIVGILILIPLTIIVVIMNFFSKDNGPIFYSQERIGKNGKHFKMYKFRSMVIGADEKLKHYLEENEDARKEYKKFKKLKDDPRITKVGNFLRKTSLDEFPQFINVLKGDMSLVGPRPYLPREVEDMGAYYNYIIKSKPGITGYWQVPLFSDKGILQSAKGVA